MTVRQFLHVPVLWESVVLSLLCMVDAFWTVLMVRQGLAVEANPLMAYFFTFGSAAFVAFKTATFIPGIIAAEYCRLTNPSFAAAAVRLGTLGYLAVYVIGDLKVNHLF